MEAGKVANILIKLKSHLIIRQCHRIYHITHKRVKAMSTQRNICIFWVVDLSIIQQRMIPAIWTHFYGRPTNAYK